MKINAYAAAAAKKSLKPFAYEPAQLKSDEIEVQITHCGICHSDVHMIDNDWGNAQFPLVPGHEIVGTVRAVGFGVKRLRVGQRVGVGWQASSCGECARCQSSEETLCARNQGVIVGRHGGFADRVQVSARFAIPIPDGLKSEVAAPLLCGGITVYTPLRAEKLQGKRVGVIGIGGLGHLALQFAAAFGCEVTAFSASPDKEREALKFGAEEFACTKEKSFFEKYAGSQDILLTTVTVDQDWNAWMGVLRPHGSLIVVGASPGTLNISPFSLIMGYKSVKGSMIGSPRLIEEMLQFAARHKIGALVEKLPMAEAEEGIRRVRAGKARYRIVLENAPAASSKASSAPKSVAAAKKKAKRK
jgi:uncharacterized zinc-type alcohol dehydrogenase-like protein